jgi:3-isopropylmalate/(R)-2-methylmalate dehydratase small subunit
VKPISTIEGEMVPLDRADVDTDQIMPKQFLKRIERDGFGEFVFFEWRKEADFVLNREAYANATILVSGPNFGSGSSREHAPWGLQQYGFRAVVAPSFGDIFSANCAKIGLLTVELPEPDCRALMVRATEDPSARAQISLQAMTIRCGKLVFGFDLEPRRRRMLMEGLDEIELTMLRQDEISRFEAARPKWVPVTNRPGRFQTT